MKNVLTMGSKILGWVVLLFVFSSIGFLTDDPSTMVPIYLIFFTLLFAGILGYHIYRFKNARQIIDVRINRQEKKTHVSTTVSIFELIIGAVLLLAAFITPSYVFKEVGFTAGIHILLVVSSMMLVALAVVAIMLINKQKPHFIAIGYGMLVILCSFPAIIMMQHDKSYHALGTAYYVAFVITVLSWIGGSMIHNNIKKYKDLKSLGNN